MNPMKKIVIGIIHCFIFTISNIAQPTDNVIAYFPFNGHANDVSGNGLNTLSTATILSADRLNKTDAAYTFNGSGSVIKLPDVMLPGNTAFAFGCWFKPTGVAAGSIAGQGIIDLRRQYQIALSYNQKNNATNPGSVSFYIYSNPTTANVFSANNSIQLNTWYHLFCNYGNNNMELYINGVLVGTQSVTPPDATIAYANCYNTIGKDYNVGINRCWTNGNIDNVLFYKRKLLATEILALYNKEKVQSEVPELYGPVSFSYDAAGNLNTRNYILLKKALAITRIDSISKSSIADDRSDSLRYSDLDQKIRIFPNPTKGLLKMVLSGFDFSQKSGITVYSPTGTTLIQHSPALPSDEIDLSGYAPGLYIMRIEVGGKTSEWKILKE